MNSKTFVAVLFYCFSIKLTKKHLTRIRYVLYNVRREGKLMKSYSSREIINILKKDGWYILRVRGDHYQMKHPTKTGKVTVQHPKKDLTKDNLKSISKQAGLTLE